LTVCFTVVVRQAELDPIHAVALVSTGSLVIYLPLYLALCETRLARLPLADIAVQAIFQGFLLTFLSLRAVATLGASGGAAFLVDEEGGVRAFLEWLMHTAVHLEDLAAMIREACKRVELVAPRHEPPAA
jgi:uncharacterized membrane protein